MKNAQIPDWGEDEERSEEGWGLTKDPGQGRGRRVHVLLMRRRLLSRCWRVAVPLGVTLGVRRAFASYSSVRNSGAASSSLEVPTREDSLKRMQDGTQRFAQALVALFLLLILLFFVAFVSRIRV